MGFIVSLYTEIIYRPLLNGLVLIYGLLPYQDLGLAIFALTLIVRALLHPTIVQMLSSQRAMSALQPRLREIQERFKSNREEQARQTMALYREAGVHPFSMFVPLLVQLPVLIGLYHVFSRGIALADPALLYSFLPAAQPFNAVAFGIFDLTAKSLPLALAAGASQFLQSKLLAAPPPAPAAGAKGGADFQKALTWQMTYFFPVFIAYISWSFPAAIAFYWTALNLLAIVQQLAIQRRLDRADHERHSRTPHPNP